ncbi:MAG TPA: hypothetical protein PKC18_08710 [Lacipirellulaceae bacterium]|nr:hypothetical protein [Lacipirellulaceae bacterium]
MLDAAEQRLVRTTTQALQIIVVALIGGCVIMLIVALALAPTEGPVRGPVAPIAAVAALGAAAGALVLPRVMAALQRQQALGAAQQGREQAAGALLQGFQVRRIVTAALLEGAAFFNGVAYLLEGTVYSLAIMAALIVGLMLLTPTRGGVGRWLADEMRSLRELEQLSA